MLEQRHSTRNFVYETMDLSTFSNIIQFSFGLSTRKLVYNDLQSTTRHYSSGEVYIQLMFLYINNISGIAKGIYKYQPYTHSLHPLEVDKIDVESFS